MLKKLNLILVLIPVFILISCNVDSNKLKVISKQQVVDKIITVMSETDTLKKGPGNFYIEFHNVSDGDFSEMGRIRATAQMQMEGGQMPGDITVSTTEIPGRYAAKYNFPMAGTWDIELTFEINGNAKFSLPVK